MGVTTRVAPTEGVIATPAVGLVMPASTGWGLTAEPAVLGLLVAPSISGGLLAVVRWWPSWPGRR